MNALAFRHTAQLVREVYSTQIRKGQPEDPEPNCFFLVTTNLMFALFLISFSNLIFPIQALTIFYTFNLYSINIIIHKLLLAVQNKKEKF